MSSEFFQLISELRVTVCYCWASYLFSISACFMFTLFLLDFKVQVEEAEVQIIWLDYTLETLHHLYACASHFQCKDQAFTQLFSRFPRLLPVLFWRVLVFGGVFMSSSCSGFWLWLSSPLPCYPPCAVCIATTHKNYQPERNWKQTSVNNMKPNQRTSWINLSSAENPWYDFQPPDWLIMSCWFTGITTLIFENLQKKKRLKLWSQRSIFKPKKHKILQLNHWSHPCSHPMGIKITGLTSNGMPRGALSPCTDFLTETFVLSPFT